MDVTVESGDWEVSSSSETEEEIIAGLKQVEGDEEHKTDDEKASEAASELGKRGGDAAAKAKQQKAKEEAKAKAEDDSEDDEEGEEKPKEGKPRDNPIARMKEATRKEAEAKRARDEAMRENLELKKRLENLESLAQRIAPQHAGQGPQGQQQPKQQQDDDPEPRMEDYDYHEWITKHQAWVGRKSAREEFSRLQREQEQQRIVKEYQENVHKNAVSFVNRLGKGLTERGMTVADLPSWFGDMESTELTGRPTPQSVVADMFFRADDPAGLALYAAEHMEEFNALIHENQTSYPRLVNALARFEARATPQNGNGNGSAPKRKVRSEDDDAGWLPAPPVGALRGSAAPSADSEDLSDDEALSRIMRSRYGRR